MPGFQFQLDPVLRHRRMIEDQCQRDLAKVMRKRMILMNQVRRLQQTITQSKHQLSGSLLGKVDMNRVGQFAAYSGEAAAVAHGLVVELAVVEKRIDQARQRLLDATKQRRVIETLRDRRYQKWLTDQRRREEAELDEVTTSQYTRRLLNMEAHP